MEDAAHEQLGGGRDKKSGVVLDEVAHVSRSPRKVGRLVSQVYPKTATKSSVCGSDQFSVDIVADRSGRGWTAP